MSGKALVLGSGPTGLIAAAHLRCLGFQTLIESASSYARPKGPFYFHDLPDITEKNEMATVVVSGGIGTKYLYEEKQWGKETYTSSFPEKELWPRELSWRPTQRLFEGLLYDVMYRRVHGLIPEDVLRLAEDYTLTVLTFPFEKVMKYWTPIVKVGLKTATDIVASIGFEDQLFALMPSQIIYLGTWAGKAHDVLRIITPPGDYTQGSCWLELTRNHSLGLGRWEDSTFYIRDMHPEQRLLTYVADLPDNILPAGRWALGNPKYLASDVMADIDQRLGDLG